MEIGGDAEFVARTAMVDFGKVYWTVFGAKFFDGSFLKFEFVLFFLFCNDV